MTISIVSTIYRRGKDSLVKYMTRIRLTPYTKWGHLRLHIFWRGDGDPDPHDHPFDFWTFPLTTYHEMVVGEDGIERDNTVHRFQWHFRKAEHIHRVVGRVAYTPRQTGRPFLTLVWASNWKRKWGFWPVVAKVYSGHSRGRLRHIARKFIPWKEYLG